MLPDKIIEKVKSYLIGNIAYVIFFTFAVIYILFKDGFDYTLNYVSILIALIIPLYFVLNLYSLIKSLLLREKVDTKEILISLALITLITLVYVFGLQEKQRIIIGVINGFLIIIIISIILVKTIRS